MMVLATTFELPPAGSVTKLVSAVTMFVAASVMTVRIITLVATEPVLASTVVTLRLAELALTLVGMR